MTLSPETRRRIDAFVSDWVADADVPGAGLALVDRDEVLYATGFGARDIEADAPATADTLFGIGSCSKSVTALAVAWLVEAGELDYADPVSDHVDAFAGTGITVDDLLTHSSGMPSDGAAVAQIARRIGAAPATQPTTSRDDFDRLLATTADDRVAAEEWPGEEEPFFYYNTGYTVLSDVVAAVADEPFREFVIETLFEPLGMPRTTYAEAEFEADREAATPYYRDPDDGEGEGTLTEGGFPFGDRVDGPGGLVASVNELARYVRFHLNGGELDGTRLVSEETLTEAHTAHATRQRFLDGAEQGYGYGWMRQPFAVGEGHADADTLVGHGGSVSVATAFLGWLEDAEIGVALACNTSADPHPMHVGPAVLALATGNEPAETVPRYALDAKLDAVVGEYDAVHSVARGTVERAGGTLTLTLATDLGDQTMHLQPTSLSPDDLTFETVSAAGAAVPVRFERGEDGTVQDLFVQRWRLQREYAA
ncbi:serine hydrolase [Halorubrum gandharaense]